MIAERKDGDSLEKKVLLKLSGTPASTRDLSTHLRKLGIKPVEPEITETLTLEHIIATVGKISAIVTDDSSFMRVASGDSWIPCIYVTREDDEIRRYKDIANVYVVSNVMDVEFLITPILRRQTEAYESIIRTIAPTEKALAELLLHSIYRRITRIEEERDQAIRERLYRECIEIGSRLGTILLQSRSQELSVLEGESEYHEDSGRKFDVGGRRIFVKIMRGIKAVPGGKEWSPMENSDQRYRDAVHFAQDLDLRIARAHPPLHYGKFSVALYDWVDGPMLNQVMHTVGDSIQRVEGKEDIEKAKKIKIKNILTGIGQGLAHHQIKGLARWITHAEEAKYHQSSEEVRTYYRYALQQLPDKIGSQLPSGIFTDKENKMWRTAVGEILGYINYELKVTRYMDRTSRNIITARPEFLKNLNMDQLIRQFAEGWGEEGRGVAVTQRTQLLPYLKSPTEHRDPVNITIDTNVRGMFFLEDFYHFTIDPGVWSVAGRYLESVVRPQFVTSVAEKLGFDPRDIRDTDCAVIGFYRAARKVGNLVDFGTNAHEDLERETIGEGRYKRRIRNFSRDIHYYIGIGMNMLGRVVEGVMKDVPIEIRSTINSFVREVTQASLTRETAESYEKFISGVKDENARVACQAAVAQAYLEKVRAKFSTLRYN